MSQHKPWTLEEDNLLKEKYSYISHDEIDNILPNRTHVAINLRARKLNLYKEFVYSRQGSISPLLEETNEAYYWTGFIAADGSISKNSRLIVGLSIKDLDHLKKLGSFLGTSISENVHKLNGKNYANCRLAIQDKILVPQFCKKFDLKQAKTYNPPNLSLPNKELFLSFFAGFADGDGSFGLIHNRTDCHLAIKNHSTWLNVLSFFENELSKYLDFKCKNLTKINNSGYAILNITNNTILRKLKEEVLKLNIPIMSRKWDNIDLNRVSKYEIRRLDEIRVLELKNNGLSRDDICDQLNLSYGKVCSIIRDKG